MNGSHSRGVEEVNCAGKETNGEWPEVATDTTLASEDEQSMCAEVL